MKQKAFFLSLFFLPLAFHGNAQGFFNQKKAMIKKCIEQIGLLKTYTAELQSGYTILKNGIDFTRDLKTGELNLHTTYYQSLEMVNSRVENYPHVEEAITLYNKIAKVRALVWKKVETSGFFTAKESRYIKGVYANLLKAAGKDMQELKKLTTNGDLKLTDDERLTRIDKAFKRIQDKYKAISDFNGKILNVLKGREAMQRESEMLKQLYGQ